MSAIATRNCSSSRRRVTVALAPDRVVHCAWVLAIIAFGGIAALFPTATPLT